MKLSFNKAGKIYITGRLPFGYEFGLHFFMNRYAWGNWNFSMPNNFSHKEIDIDAGPLMRLHVFHEDDM